MKVLFSNPPWWGDPIQATGSDGLPVEAWMSGVRAGSRWPFTLITESSPDNFRFGTYKPYPFFMGYAATFAKRETGTDVRFRDSIALADSYETYFRHLVDENYRYIFIESASPSWEHDVEIIKGIRRISPQTRIVVTGPIAANWKAILEDLPVHAVIQGEYEKGSVKVIHGAEGLVEYDLLTKEEMNDSPYPYFDDVIAHRYWDGCPAGQRPPQLQLWSSRGCPYKCIFCVWPAVMTGNDPDGAGTRTVRHYTADYIDGFVREMVGRYRYQTVYFDDDTFNLGNSHVVRISEVMSRIGVPWSAMCRADTIKKETWQVMKDAGCFGVKLGFESGNQQVVDKIVNKRLDLEAAADVVRHLKGIGMTVHGTFTYGLPGETAEQMQDTKNFIASLPFDSYQESGTAEIEGTPLATLRREGHLAAYEGATIDDTYEVEADGAKKFRDLAEKLKAS
jgi:radical SAM superfamily enzyme YgiQ (UPF0313 family)